MIQLGPQVGIVDDKPEEIFSIQNTLDSLHVGNTFFKVDFTEPKYPEKPIDTIQLLFLDLHYNENYGAAFDPYFCINWINKIVPKGQVYTLVVWTRDAGNAHELDELMKEVGVGVPYPSRFEVKVKPDYQTGKDPIRRLLDEVGVEYIEYADYEDITEKKDVIFGQVIDIEDDSIFINCLVSENPNIFEVRSFDTAPFRDFANLKSDDYIKIQIATKPGSRRFEFFHELEDMSERFAPTDPFAEFKDFDLLSE